MSCETLPQISGNVEQTLQEYTLIPGVIRADTGNGEVRCWKEPGVLRRKKIWK